MTCSIIWMALCKISLRRRIHGRKTCTSPWSWRNRSCFIYYAELNPTRGIHLISAHLLDPFRRLWSFRKWDKGMDMNPEEETSYRPPNTKRHSWSMWRMNTAPYVNVCRSLNPKLYWTTISSPLERLQHPVNLPSTHLICPVMMNNTYHLTMWLKLNLDEAIALHAYWPPPGSIWFHCLNDLRTGGKKVQISIITTPTQWICAVHFGYRISPTAGDNKRKLTNSTPISWMWRASYSLSYHMVSEQGPVVPLRKMLSAGDSQNNWRDTSQKCHCKAVCASQWRIIGRWWPSVGYDSHRKRLGNAETARGMKIAQNGQCPRLFEDVAGQL